MSLTDAINSAVKEMETPDKEEKVVEKTDESPLLEESEEEETPTEEEEESTSETEDDELSEDEIKEARNLYKLLKNPASAKDVIQHLADKTGLSKVDTKTEVKESKKAILDIFKEKLGPEFGFISEKISAAVEEVLNAERKERDDAQKVIEAKKVEAEVVSVFKELNKRTNGESIKLEAKMMKIAEDFLPGPNTSVKVYVNQLYTLATAGKQVNNNKVIDKIRQNSNDTSGRLRATGGNAGEKSVVGKLPDKKMNLDESIKWALEQQSGGKK